MKKLENQKFEESWKEALANAEVDPQPSVWHKVDLQLSKDESKVMRGRIVFYQRLAAACLLLAFIFGTITVLNISDKRADENVLANNNSSQNENQLLRQSSEINSTKQNDMLSRRKSIVENKLPESKTNRVKMHEADTNQPNQYASRKSIAKGSRKDEPLYAATELYRKDSAARVLTNQIPIRHNHDVAIDIHFPTIEIVRYGQPRFDWVISQAPIVSDLGNITQQKDNKKKNWWASIGGSSGVYYPQRTSNYSASAYSGTSVGALSSSNNSTLAKGTSFSVGLMLGKHLTSRWSVQTGINYMVQANYYSSSFVANGSQAFLADLYNQSAPAGINSTTTYQLNSVNDFISVPAQVGYLALQRRVGLQLNAGVAADLFLKNSLIDPSGGFSTSTQSAGDSSPYQQLAWTGLANIELSYKISTRYQVSCFPGVRYSFQSILKPTALVSMRPFVWDIGVRFKYIF